MQRLHRMPPDTPRVRAPRRFRALLEEPLFDAFRLYVRALSQTDRMRFEEWGRRRVRNNDPLATLIHRTLTARVEAALRRPVKPSYAFLACYGDGAILPAHRDREQCRYTLDLCLEAGERRPWPLYVDGRPYALRPNEGLLYFGCDQTHFRRGKPPGPVHVALFHFVDADFDGELD